MLYNYPIRPEFKEICDLMKPLLAGDQAATQAMIDEGYKDWNNCTSEEEIKVTKYSIPSYDGKIIELQVLESQDTTAKSAPCLVYYHGGGFILPMLKYHYGFIREYIRGTSCKVVCVNYRVAPDAFPDPLEDCYHTLLWTHQNAASLGIDPERIVLGGDSAGGLFAAAVALKSRDEKGPKAIAQMLLYPATDSRLQTESMKTFTDTPVWNAIITEMVWQLFLKDGDQGMRSYCSPMEADSFANLPQAYVEVAEYDCLRDEGINYAQALQKAGVSTELNQTHDTVHGYDYIPGSELIKEAFKKRIQFLNKVMEK